MTLKRRLLRLEARARPLDQGNTVEDRLSEEQWLEEFAAWGRQGLFAAEPDFPRALEEYRQALAAAQAQADPPWLPPDDFLPGLADLPHLRLGNWRDRTRFPAVWAGWSWLAEILDRVREGVPPVTEAEFAELAGWFHANDAWLYQRSLPSQLLDSEQVCVGYLRYGVAQGPRASGAGALAEQLRRLKARYGSEQHAEG
jgi:hypothetical protein